MQKSSPISIQRLFVVHRFIVEVPHMSPGRCSSVYNLHCHHPIHKEASTVDRAVYFLLASGQWALIMFVLFMFNITSYFFVGSFWLM